VASLILNKKNQNNSSVKSVREKEKEETERDKPETITNISTSDQTSDCQVNSDKTVTSDSDVIDKKYDSLPKRKSLSGSDTVMSNSVPNLSKYKHDNLLYNINNKEHLKSMLKDKCFVKLNQKYNNNSKIITDENPPNDSNNPNVQPNSANKKPKNKFVKFTKSPRILKVGRNIKAAKDFQKMKKKQFFNLSTKRKSHIIKESTEPSQIVSAEERKKHAALHKMKRERKVRQTKL